MTTSKKIIKIINNFFRDNRNKELLKHVRSVYVINSLARGDFIDNVSDIDVLIIFKDRITLKNSNNIASKFRQFLNPLLKEFKTSHEGDVLDMPWEIESKIKQSKINCFQFYFKDLKQNNILVYGDDILAKMRLAEPTKEDRKKRIKKLIKHFNKSNTVKESNLFTGSIIKHFLFLKGLKSLHKFDIIDFLEKKKYPGMLEFFKKCRNNKANTKKQLEINKRIITQIKKSLKKAS